MKLRECWKSIERVGGGKMWRRNDVNTALLYEIIKNDNNKTKAKF